MEIKSSYYIEMDEKEVQIKKNICTSFIKILESQIF